MLSSMNPRITKKGTSDCLRPVKSTGSTDLPICGRCCGGDWVSPLALLAIVGTVLAIIQRKDADKILLALCDTLPATHRFTQAEICPPFAADLSSVGTICGKRAYDRVSTTILPIELGSTKIPLLKQWATPILYAVILGGVGVYSLIYTAAFANVTRSTPTSG